MSSSLCDSNPCRPQRCILCNNNCTNGYTCVENEMDSGFEFTSGIIGGICAAGIIIIIILLVVVLVGLFLLWRRKSDVRTLMIQGHQRERFTYQSYYKKTQDVAGFKLERKQSKKSGSYNPGFEMSKKLNMFLPHLDISQIDDVIPTGDPNTVYNDLYDENIEDDFLKETAVTQVIFSEPAENNVQLLDTSVVSSVTAYENLDFDDDDDDKDDVDHSDFMTKENFNAKKKRVSSIKIWSSSNKGVLEITPDPEIV